MRTSMQRIADRWRAARCRARGDFGAAGGRTIGARTAGGVTVGAGTLAAVTVGDEPSDRGDVPGWVLVTLMTAGLVSALWLVAGNALVNLFQTAISSVTP